MFHPAMLLVKERQLQPIQIALRARAPLAWAIIGFALLGLVISFASVHKSVLSVFGTSATHPFTALCLIGLGVGIIRSKRYGASSKFRLGLLGMILMVCTMRMMGGALVAYAGVAPIPVFGPTVGFLGYFSLEMAMTLGAFAAAALLRQGNGRWGPALLIIGSGCVFNMGLTSVFGVRADDSALSWLTLMAMVCANMAMVSLYVHRPFVRVAFLIGDIGSQTRVMAAVVVAVPLGAALLVDGLGASGGLSALDVGVLTLVCSAMLIILLATSAHHEGSVATRRRAAHDIAMRSRINHLTGALNRFGMTEVVEGAWLEFKSTGAQFGLILLDLEYFRRLDATFGHDDAKDVLGRVARTVQAQLRGMDALGRWDKDEFMVLVRIKDISNIAIVADRLRQSLMAADGQFCAGLTMEPAHMDIAMGMSAFREDDDTAALAIIRADIDLNDVKSTEKKMLADLEADTPFDLLQEPEDETETSAAAA